MYDSPITLIKNIADQMMVEQENAITMTISEQIGIDIDKEELIKALNYDRNQYEKGYADAKSYYEQKWIPVSERLPVEDKYNHGEVWERSVLVTAYFPWDSKKHTFTSEMLAEDVISGKSLNGCVVAWMPKPKPYRAESEEV